MRRFVTCLLAAISIATCMSGRSFALDIKLVDWKGVWSKNWSGRWRRAKKLTRPTQHHAASRW